VSVQARYVCGVGSDGVGLDEQSPARREESLARASVAYWRLAEFVNAGVSTLMALVIAGALTYYAESLWVAFVCAGIVLLASTLWAFLTPALRYRRFRFSVQGSRLWIRSGVFFHREKSIPLARIQHVDVSRGPLERMFGLARVTVFTAGGRLATAQIPGLEPARADALRLELLGATESLAQGVV
jgi:membrane protein YdbS with pleckstrin-like domain